MDGHFFAVIMAGGGGTRMWPLSRQAQPKQMLQLFDNRTMFQMSVDRLAGMFPPERILVVTVADQADQLMALAPSIPQENFLLEPIPRGTASVVGLAAVALRARDPEAVMAIVTSDHAIGNIPYFHQLLSIAYDVAQENYLVTLGITPAHPSTGYGYIQLGSRLAVYQGLDVFHVVRFKEKPDAETAREFLASEDHVWNSGMFIWRTELILEEFKRQMPGLSSGLEKIAEAWGGPTAQKTVETIWTELESETIDYGIMERARRCVVIPALDLSWSDVGSWDSLFGILPADPHGNIVQGQEGLLLETEASLFLESKETKLFVGIGLKDLIVVDTDDVLLVCHREHTQQVRDVVNRLRENQDKRYL